MLRRLALLVVLVVLAAVPALVRAQSTPPVPSWLRDTPKREWANMFRAAASDADLERAEMLLGGGLDANYALDGEESLLHLAAYYGRMDFVDLLLERGADARRLNARNQTPRDVAMANGHLDVGAFLTRVQNGESGASTAREDADRAIADVKASGTRRDTRTGKDKAQQLAAAASDGDVARVTALLDAGADPDWQFRDTGWTPLMFAAMSGRAEIVRLMLARGANLRLADRAGRTAVELARQRGHGDVVRAIDPAALAAPRQAATANAAPAPARASATPAPAKSTPAPAKAPTVPATAPPAPAKSDVAGAPSFLAAGGAIAPGRYDCRDYAWEQSDALGDRVRGNEPSRTQRWTSSFELVDASRYVFIGTEHKPGTLRYDARTGRIAWLSGAYGPGGGTDVVVTGIYGTRRDDGASVVLLEYRSPKLGRSTEYCARRR